ncbi:MAG: hypothetical protein HC768_17385, partial [Acaryochloris sp. CRU_2_0]|nr:hypothetical protein [Acaryochloris sp. CRU_2_0]
MCQWRAAYFLPWQRHRQASRKFRGQIGIDGSSTVFPHTEAMAEEFQKANSKVQVDS